jgi:hypothetical protein
VSSDESLANRLFALAFPLLAVSFVMFAAIFPRLDRLPVAPQAAMLFPGLAFGLGKFADMLVLGVMPPVPRADLVEVDVMFAYVKATAVAAFAVDLDGIETDVLPINLFTQTVPGGCPVSLTVFRRVDSVQTNSVAATGFVLNCAGIAVLDRDHSTLDQTALQTPFAITLIRKSRGRYTTPQ